MRITDATFFFDESGTPFVTLSFEDGSTRTLVVDPDDPDLERLLAETFK